MIKKRASSMSASLGCPPGGGANHDRDEGVDDVRIVGLPLGAPEISQRSIAGLPLGANDDLEEASSMSAPPCCPWGRTMIAKGAS